MAEQPLDTSKVSEGLVAFVRARHEAVLLIDDDAHRVKVTIDGWRGRPVFSAPPGIDAGADAVLCIPEDGDDSVQLLGETCLVTPGTEPADRWIAYHGDPRTTRWLDIAVECAKGAGEVLDGPDLDLRNALHACESVLTRRANADESALRAMCRRRAGIDIAAPRVVGVDDRGLDARARFGIVRIPFPSRAADEAAALSMLDALLRGDP